MVTPELLDYIKQHLSQGLNRSNIEEELLKAGWHQEDINLAFTQTQTGAVPAPTTGKLPGPMAIFKEALEIYKSRLWVLVGISVISTLFILLVTSILGGGALLLNKLGVALPQGTASIIGIIILVSLVVIAAIYISILAQAALLTAIKDSEEKIGIKESFKRGSHRAGVYFAAALLTGLATLGGFILLIVPGIIFAIWYSLSSYIAISEDVTASQALKQSRFYVKGFWWATLGRFIFIGIVYLIISFIIGFVGGIISSAMSGNNKEVQSAISQAINQIISLFLGPLAAVYGYTLYKHLKSLKS